VPCTHSMRMLLLVLLALPVMAQAQSCAEFNRADLPLGSYTESANAAGKSLGFILLVHGLNLDPARMQDIARFLQDAGYRTLTVRLAGHRQDAERWQGVNYALWYGEMWRLQCLAAARASELELPLYLFAYSLGAALGLDALSGFYLSQSGNKEDLPRFRKIVLLAPALKLKWYSTLFLNLPLLPASLHFNSLAPQAYRADPRTSMGAYRALGDSISAWHRKSALLNLPVPVMVLMDPQDELVSYQGIRDFASANARINWQFMQLNNDDATLQRPHHHLIIDEASLGAAQWQVLQKAVLDFLAE
jgi:alpha-beta hydrolase superfamily lysophospholipase